jgi:type IV secretion system protein VirB10
MSNTEENNTEENNLEEVDRGMPSVNTAPTNSFLKKSAPYFLGLASLGALIAVNGGFSDGEGSVIEENGVKTASVRNLIGDAPPLPPKPKIIAPPKVIPPQPIIVTKQPPPIQKPQYRKGGEKVLTPEERKRQAGLLAFGSNQGSNQRVNYQGSGLSPEEQAQRIIAEQTGQPERADGLNAKLASTTLTGVKAGLLVDRNMFITKGTFLDCALETAISSDLAGMTSCRLTNDVYSTSGKVLLLERGSRIVGQYESGLQRGKARIFVLWSRVETPTGVVVNIDSPGTGPLGRSGHSGYVDTHFWERFGGAIMLSLVDDFGNYLSQRAANNSNNGSNLNFGGTSDAAEGAVSTVLKNTINIPPTLIKHQGEHINIFVARDLDFRTVYELKAKN